MLTPQQIYLTMIEQEDIGVVQVQLFVTEDSEAPSYPTILALECYRQADLDHIIGELDQLADRMRKIAWMKEQK